MVALAVQTVQMNRGQGQVDAVQGRVQQRDLIGLQPVRALGMQAQLQFGDTAHQIIQGGLVGALRIGFHQGLAHAPGQVKIARGRVHGVGAVRAVKENRAARDPVNRLAIQGLARRAAKRFLGQALPGG